MPPPGRQPGGAKGRPPSSGREKAHNQAPPSAGRSPWSLEPGFPGRQDPAVVRILTTLDDPRRGSPRRARTPASAHRAMRWLGRTSCRPSGDALDKERSFRDDTAVWQMGVNRGQWRSQAVKRSPSSKPHSCRSHRWSTASRPIGGVLYPVARAVAIHLRGLPGDIGRAARPLLGLAPGGACISDRVAPAAGALLPHRFTLACARHPGHRRSALCCAVLRVAPTGR